MPLAGVLGASVVVVIAVPGLGPLDLPLANDLVPTLARNQVAAVGQFVGPVDLPAQQGLHPVPRLAVHKRGMLARIPLPLVLHFADVGAVMQDGVQGAPGESGRTVPVHDALCRQPLNEHIERQAVVGE